MTPFQVDTAVDPLCSLIDNILSRLEALEAHAGILQSDNNNNNNKTTTTSSSVLVLVSWQSFDKEVLANQQTALQVLQDCHVSFQTLDGSDPALKDRRNELFQVSGLRAKYPQFFLVPSNNNNENDNDQVTFWGDWMKFQMTHHKQQIPQELGGTTTATAATTTVLTSTATGEPYVLVLISLQSLDRQVMVRQESLLQVLQDYQVSYQTLDGADPLHKSRRNDLFQLSGLRAQYPQVFQVDAQGHTTFWGDYTQFQSTLDKHQIAREFHGVTPTTTTTTTPLATNTSRIHHILVLVSLQSFDREVLAHQENALAVLKSHETTIRYETLDGADPSHKTRRNELFALSGLRAQYPQFFTVTHDGATEFWGDYGRFQMTNDANQIAMELQTSSETTTPAAPAQSTNQVGSRAVAAVAPPPNVPVSLSFPNGLLVLVSLQSFDRSVVTNQQTAQSLLAHYQVPYSTLDGADPACKAQRNALFEISGIRAQYPQFFWVEHNTNIQFWGDWDQFQSTHERNEIAQALGGTPSTEAPAATSTTTMPQKEKVLVLVSLQTFDREVITNQEIAVAVLNNHDINYTTLDGADPLHKSRRNELFQISGIRAQYPQFFQVKEATGETTFWGDFDKFQWKNDSNEIANELGGGK